MSETTEQYRRDLWNIYDHTLNDIEQGRIATPEADRRKWSPIQWCEFDIAVTKGMINDLNREIREMLAGLEIKPWEAYFVTSTLPDRDKQSLLDLKPDDGLPIYEVPANHPNLEVIRFNLKRQEYNRMLRSYDKKYKRLCEAPDKKSKKRKKEEPE